MPDGRLDPSFSGDGRRALGFANGEDDDESFDVAIQTDGRIVVAGYSEQGGRGKEVAVARFKADGSRDRSFSGDGRRTFGFAYDDAGIGVAIQPDQKIVVSGFSDHGRGREFAVARLRPNGDLDRSFSGDGRQTFGFPERAGPNAGQGVAIQHDRKIVVTGSKGDRIAIARLNPDGTLDSRFSGDGRRLISFGRLFDVGVRVVAPPNGRIVVAGSSFRSIDPAATDFDFAVARLNPRGALDQSFSGDGKVLISFQTGDPGVDAGFDVATQPDGKLVVAGRSSSGVNAGVPLILPVGVGPSGKSVRPYDFAVARLNPGGSLDQSFSGDGKQLTSFATGPSDDQGNAVAIQSDGRIVAAGASDQGGASTVDYDFALARYLGG
jgi:uncharacterized delta-60 repeat protein